MICHNAQSSLNGRIVDRGPVYYTSLKHKVKLETPIEILPIASFQYHNSDYMLYLINSMLYLLESLMNVSWDRSHKSLNCNEDR